LTTDSLGIEGRGLAHGRQRLGLVALDADDDARHAKGMGHDAHAVEHLLGCSRISRSSQVR
jgi:hypothetical protein